MNNGLTSGTAILNIMTSSITFLLVMLTVRGQCVDYIVPRL